MQCTYTIAAQGCLFIGLWNDLPLTPIRRSTNNFMYPIFLLSKQLFQLKNIPSSVMEGLPLPIKDGVSINN
jgi:hypothetical protein